METLEKRNYFDLSIPQENIWLTEQLNQNTNINQVYGTVFIHQSLDLDIVKKTINRIIENNDALRIRVSEKDAKPMQWIEPYEYEDIPVYFLEDDDDDKIHRIIESIGLEHLSVENHKLYDIRVIYHPDFVYLCLKMHHLIADAWSIGQLFIENFNTYYTEAEHNIPSQKRPSYLNYLEKNEQYKNSERYLRDQKFWQKQIQTFNCKNEFNNTKSKKSNRIEKQLDANLLAKIQPFCEENKVSEYAFFLAILSIYFSKIFSNNDLVIGTPFLNRKKADKELDTMGMFVATLPIPVHFSSELNFTELCKQITATNLSCFKHSHFPYQEIQKEYNDFSGDNQNLYEIAFSYQKNNLEKDFDHTIYKNTWISNGYQINPLLITYFNHFGEHQLCYDYWTDCFTETDIHAMHERLLYIIHQVLRNNEIAVQNVKLLSSEDITLLQQFNDTGDRQPIEETIVSRFEKIVSKHKTKIALKCGDVAISYKELNQKANSIAHTLIKLGAKKGSPVSIIFDKSPEMFMTMLGILKAGCYYVPILPEEEQNRAEFIVENSESTFLITSKKYSTQIKENGIIQKLVVDDLLEGDFSDLSLSIKPSDLCYLIYTSGSTGTPKGVMIKHENVLSLMASMDADDDLKFLESDIAISLLKYSFDASAIDIYSSLLHGGTLIILPKEVELNPEKVVETIELEKVTRTFTVHKWIEQIQNIASKKKLSLESLRTIGTGAEVLKPQKFQDLLKNHPNLKLYNTYGPTESTVFVTKHSITDLDIEKNSAPIGNLIPYTRAVILNANNEILPIGFKGELTILEDATSAKNISNGYWKQEELTSHKFIKIYNPWTQKLVKAYKTGDIAKINHNLELEFLGREDDFKKVNGGYLVSLNEVEHKIQTILGNSIETCVVSIPSGNINAIILYIVKKGNSVNVKLDDIKNEINNHITFYMKPKKIIEVDKLPLNKNGKINKKLLASQAIQTLNETHEFMQPTNKLEQSIYDAVKEIIHCDFSITDDFEEDLGIDSLNMTLLYAKLANQKITIQDLYNYPTVKDLAYLIKKELSSDEIITDEPIRILNASNQMSLEKVLLTGTTGFVGTHLLRELAENEKIEKIYCIVRQKLNLDSKERFENIIHTYFDEETCKKIKQKAIILNGDLRKEFLGLEPNTYQRVFKEVRTIINTAANVKHMGKYHTSYIDNVETVHNLIQICHAFSISLVHISTLSLNGYYNQNVHETFTENTLNIHQTFNKNPYLISKYEAEKLILKSIYEEHLNAKIFRIGNIMPRVADGVFQVNYEQSGFLLAIQALSNLQIVPESMTKLKIALTPVDECCRAMGTLLESDYGNTIYHIENNKKTTLSSLLDILTQRNIEFKIVDDKAFEKQLTNHYSVGSEYLKSHFTTDYNKYSNEITSEILTQLDFEWQPIKKDYLENIINISMKIK